MIALQRSRLLTMLLILTVLSSIALRTFPASAQPNYSPGVKAGDSITYGEFSINGTTPYPPFPPNTTSLKLTVHPEPLWQHRDRTGKPVPVSHRWKSDSGRPVLQLAIPVLLPVRHQRNC